MFGYVRPNKPELLVREFSRYRSVYCGICKQIGHDYGPLPRLALNYDLTLLAVLLLALADEQPVVRQEGCILNPLLKKPIVRGGDILELSAGLTVLLAGYNAKDNVHDRRSAAALVTLAALLPAWRKARRRYPSYDVMIAAALAELTRYEAGEPDLAASTAFGKLLQDLFILAAGLVTEEEAYREAIGLLGRDLGQWVYLLDAIDDWADDCNNGNWNPFGRLDHEAARAEADRLLQALELAMDRTAALLPYRQDSSLVANIFTQGLPEMRRKVLSGERPGRL